MSQQEQADSHSAFSMAGAMWTREAGKKPRWTLSQSYTACQVVKGPARFARNSCNGGFMGRKIAYWVSTAIVGAMLLMALSYLTGNEQVVSGFVKWISATPADCSWNCQARRSDRPAGARICAAERMGLCGRHLHLDYGHHLRSRVGRADADMDYARGTFGAAWRFLCDSACEPAFALRLQAISGSFSL